MGKNNEYKDDYTGHLDHYMNRRKKIKILAIVLIAAAGIAACTATYFLMNRADTMEKDGIQEMEPNEDFVIVGDNDDAEIVGTLENAAIAEDDSAPFIEDADVGQIVMPDAIPADDGQDAAPDAFSADTGNGGNEDGGAGAAEIRETETESEPAQEMGAETPADTPTDTPTDTGVEAMIAGAGTTASGETAEEQQDQEDKEQNPEDGAGTETIPQKEVLEENIGEPDTEKETTGKETAAEEETAASESPKVNGAEAETETETEAFLQVPKTEDEVFVETEGEPMKQDMITGVQLEIKGTDGDWIPANQEEGERIEVPENRMLKFRITCTVPPEELSAENRTLIYRVPEQIIEVNEEYGEIVDRSGSVIASCAIQRDGVIRITFTDEIAGMNAAGASVICRIEFSTAANALNGE